MHLAASDQPRGGLALATDHRRRTMGTTSEGTVPFRGYRTWYRAVGELPAPAGKPPLLVLHGGPGFPHDYLEDLAGLADRGRPVVFYDQLGCGRSDHPDEAS